MRFPRADDKVTALRKAPVALPVGSLVRYYSDGWYSGYLIETKGKFAYIQPIAAYKAGKPHKVKILITDTEKI